MSGPELGAAADLVPPFSPEAEMSVLGGMLIDALALPAVIEELGDGTALYREGSRRLYRSMVALFERGEPVDPITLSEELASRGDLEMVGGMPYVAQLLDAVPTAANIKYHCRIVREKATLRRLIATAEEIVRSGYRADAEPERLVAEAEARILSVSQGKRRGGFVWGKDLMWPALERLEARTNSTRGVPGVSTGFEELDDLTAGFQKGELIILAGRPSQGKTAAALAMCEHVALVEKKPVGFFSLEMSKESLTERRLCMEARVDFNRFRRGRLSDDEYGRISTAMGYLPGAPLYIDDTAGLTILELRARARRLKADHPDLALIVVDYLQLAGGARRSENRQQEVAEISRNLKEMAKELDVPVLALSQLSRDLEKRADKRPMMSDLRESGALEQDADLIIFVFRPETYYGLVDKDGNSLEGKAEFIIGKQRNGALDTIHVKFIKEFTRFEGYHRRVA